MTSWIPVFTGMTYSAEIQSSHFVKEEAIWPRFLCWVDIHLKR